MKKLTFVLSLALVAAGNLLAQAQYEPHGAVKPSIVRPAALGGYDGGGFTGYGYGYNYEYMHGSCACQPKGCSRGVCHGYDNCCVPCPTLFCALKRVGHMLDCLLPCYACKPSPCKPLGGLFGHGGCGPHLFAKGKCHGCSSGCGPVCDGACPTCTSPVPTGPAATNPFIDDPPVPAPLPDEDEAKGVRRHPIWKTPTPSPAPASPALSASASAKPKRIGSNPYRLAAGRYGLTPQPRVPSVPAASDPAPVIMSSRRVAKAASHPVAEADESAAAPEAVSVLRRLSHEEEAGPLAAPHASSAVPAPPLPQLAPVPVEPAAATDSTIPVNPLRQR
ncbi:MAG: hypothetical protein SFU86_03585 [Pirellulaceae bacterium]|nr:hypothetical protein [Pirellulaceae bacterium]